MVLFISNFLGTGPSILEILIRVLLTAIFVGFIGVNRQLKGKIAGLTTHLMVALGAAAVGILQEAIFLDSLNTAQELLNQGIAIDINIESQRVIAAAITGVGFLGAGAILKTKSHIYGLTTAATLWVSAIIGIIFGMGHYTLGIIVSIISLFSLIFLRKALQNTGLRHLENVDVKEKQNK